MERSPHRPRARHARPASHPTRLARLLTLACCAFAAAVAQLAVAGTDASASTPPPPKWRFETLDGHCPPSAGCAGLGASAANVGVGTATARWNDRPHVWFQDVDNGDLRHGWWTGTAWRFSTLDGNCSEGPCAAAGAIDSAVGGRIAVVLWRGAPHVFYEDLRHGALRHAWWATDRWYFETLDGACTDERCARRGATNSNVGGWATAVVWNDQPHVFYRDATNGDLRQTFWNGTAWNFLTLDGNCRAGGPCGGRVGTTTANVGTWNTAVNWNGELHLFTHDSTNGDLRHGWWAANRWNFETLDGNCSGGDCASRGAVRATVGRSASAVVWAGTPHVTYYDLSGGNLRHGWWTGSRWRFETLDGNCTGGTECAARGATSGNVGFHGVLSVWNNQPHVWYYDNSNDDLRHGWWNGTRWRFETLDGNCPAGTACAASGATERFVGLDPAFLEWDGRPHVWYRDWMDGTLRHGWYA